MYWRKRLKIISRLSRDTKIKFPRYSLYFLYPTSIPYHFIDVILILFFLLITYCPVATWTSSSKRTYQCQLAFSSCSLFPKLIIPSQGYLWLLPLTHSRHSTQMLASSLTPNFQFRSYVCILRIGSLPSSCQPFLVTGLKCPDLDSCSECFSDISNLHPIHDFVSIHSPDDVDIVCVSLEPSRILHHRVQVR